MPAGFRATHRLITGGLMEHERGGEVLEHLLDLDGRDQGMTLRSHTLDQLAAWPPSVFRQITRAEWEAGETTTGLANEEQRRGLPGLGSLPEPVQTASEGALARARAAPPAHESAPADPATWSELVALPVPVGAAASPELLALDDGALARRAEEAMLRWEAYQRIADVVFAALAERFEAEGETARAFECLGPGAAALMLGEGSVRDQADLLVALALGNKLLLRCRPQVEPLIAALAAAPAEELRGDTLATAALLIAGVKRMAGDAKGGSSLAAASTRLCAPKPWQYPRPWRLRGALAERPPGRPLLEDHRACPVARLGST